MISSWCLFDDMDTFLTIIFLNQRCTDTLWRLRYKIFSQRQFCFWNSIDCMIFDANFFLPNAHIGVNSIILYKLQYYSIDLYATSKRNQKNKMSLQTAKVKYVREWVDGVESHFKDCWRHHTKYNTILWFLSKEDHNLIIIIKYVDNVGRAYVYD